MKSTNSTKQPKYSAFWLMFRLYAYKLANYAFIMDATNTARHIDDMSTYDAPKVGPVNLFRRTHYNRPGYQEYCDELELQTISSEYFLVPVLHQVQDANFYKDSAKNVVSKYQRDMIDLVRVAQKEKIIDEKFNILDMKKFKTKVLEKSVLPCSLPDPDLMYTLNCPEYPNVFLFHSLTNVGFTHLIREQTEQVFNEPVYGNQVYQNGTIHNPNILRDALEELHYRRFTNHDEITAAVGTDGMQLARQIRDRMFEHIKQPQKA